MNRHEHVNYWHVSFPESKKNGITCRTADDDIYSYYATTSASRNHTISTFSFTQPV
jgi:hypothetical protein